MKSKFSTQISRNIPLLCQEGINKPRADKVNASGLGHNYNFFNAITNKSVTGKFNFTSVRTIVDELVGDKVIQNYQIGEMPKQSQVEGKLCMQINYIANDNSEHTLRLELDNETGTLIRHLLPEDFPDFDERLSSDYFSDDDNEDSVKQASNTRIPDSEVSTSEKIYNANNIQLRTKNLQSSSKGGITLGRGDKTRFLTVEQFEKLTNSSKPTVNLATRPLVIKSTEGSERPITVINGYGMYRSTGESSGVGGGTWFPFLKYDAKYVKPETHVRYSDFAEEVYKKNYGLTIAQIGKIFTKNDTEREYVATYNPKDGSSWGAVTRLGNLEAACISANIGGGWWDEHDEGKSFKQYLQSDHPQLYNKCGVTMPPQLSKTGAEGDINQYLEENGQKHQEGLPTFKEISLLLNE